MELLPAPGPPVEYAYSGQFLYAAAGTAGVHVVDLSAPGGGKQLVRSLATAAAAIGVEVVGTSLWVAEANPLPYLESYDLADPSAALFLGVVEYTGGWAPLDLRLADEVAVIFTDGAETVTAPLHCDAAATGSPIGGGEDALTETLRSWPNPARGDTMFEFGQPEVGEVRLGIYDVNGRLVRNVVSEVRFGRGLTA